MPIELWDLSEFFFIHFCGRGSHFPEGNFEIVILTVKQARLKELLLEPSLLGCEIHFLRFKQEKGLRLRVVYLLGKVTCKEVGPCPDIGQGDP